MNETAEYEPLAKRIQQAYTDQVPTVVVLVNTYHEGKSLLYELEDWFGPFGMLRRFEISQLRLHLGIEGGHLMRVKVVPLSPRTAHFERAIRGYRPVLVLDADGTEVNNVNGMPKEMWS